MSTPAPRPALRKAADAHIHPAAPGHDPGTLRVATPDPAQDAPVATGWPAAGLVPSPTPSPERGLEAGRGTTGRDQPPQHRLSGPLGGTTSDSLRAAAKGAGRHRQARAKQKLVTLEVKVPKDLRKEFHAAAKADRQDPDAIVTALLQAWLHG